MDVGIFSLGFVDDIDAIDEDVFHTAREIWRVREVRHVLLYYSSYIDLSIRY